MGSRFCSCNNKKENKFELKFLEETDESYFQQPANQFSKSKIFSKVEHDKLCDIYLSNSIKKIQRLVRNTINSNKDMSTNFNYNSSFKAKKNSVNSNFLNATSSPIMIGQDVK